MRSLSILKSVTLIAACAALSGCLVSEDPVLDAKTGRAKPIKAGAYVMCPLGEESDEDDCENFIVEVDADGLYRFLKEDEDPAEMRFRRVGRRGYAVQSHENDGYMYYYGAGTSKRFQMTMMLCADLTEKVRMRLIENGDLESEGDDFDTCVVNTVRGLTDAARAYHRGDVTSDEEIKLEFTPAPDVK